MFYDLRPVFIGDILNEMSGSASWEHIRRKSHCCCLHICYLLKVKSGVSRLENVCL